MNIKLTKNIILTILIQIFILGSFIAKVYGADTTPPVITMVFDDGDYTSSTTQLHASWFSIDPESDIGEYRYAIGTSWFGTDIVDWTSAGTSHEVTETGLNLIDGQIYYFSVEAVNGAGLIGYASTDGIKVDSYPPVWVTIYDDGGDYTSSNTQLQASWYAADMNSGIAEFQYSIGTSPLGTDVVDWKSIGLLYETTVTGLNLIDGQIYYFNIKAIDGAGLTSSNSSDGIIVDTSPPPILLVFDDGDATSSNTQLHASWHSEDPHSGIAGFQYAIGTTYGGTDIVYWESAGTSTEITRTNLYLTHGQKCYFSVKAINGAGLIAYGYSDGIIIDNDIIPPIVEIISPAYGAVFTTPLITVSGTVDDDEATVVVNGKEVIISSGEFSINDIELTLEDNMITVKATDLFGNSSLYCIDVIYDNTKPIIPVVTDDGQYIDSNIQLHASWYSDDPNSGIAEYQYSIGTTPGSIDIVSWTSTGLETKVTHPDIYLEHNQTYYFNVKAQNNAGMWSDIGSSDGIIVNTTIPSIISISPENDSTFFTGTEVVIDVYAEDEDADPLEYQFLVEDEVKRDWNSSSNYEWIASPTTTNIRKITCKVRDDKEGITSEDVYYNVQINISDTTPPTIPIVYTNEYSDSLDCLYASWSSEDYDSGIVEFKYAIGTISGGTDIVDWTSAGIDTTVIHYGLSLTAGQNYFVSVKATNGVNLTSTAGNSSATNATPKVNLKITSPHDGALITQNTFTIKGIAEDVGTVLVNGRPVRVNPDGTFSGPILVAPGYAARQGITGSNPNYIIMSYPDSTDITIEAYEKPKTITIYCCQLFVKNNFSQAPPPYNYYWQIWNNNLLVECPFPDWANLNYCLRTWRDIYADGSYRYYDGGWYYYNESDLRPYWWSTYTFFYNSLQKNLNGEESNRFTSRMTIHTLPDVNGQIQPMVIIFKNCYFRHSEIYNFDLSRYKINSESLKMLYGRWDSYCGRGWIPNACYIVLTDYEPDIDIEIKVTSMPNYYDALYLGQYFRYFSCEEIDILTVDITTPIDTDMNITNEPAMPDVTFHADIKPEERLANTTFHWYLTVTFEHDTLGKLTHRVPASGTDDIQGNGDWTPDWATANLFAGGDVHVYVKASFDDSSFVFEDSQDGYKIKGTNPTQVQIFGIADDIKERAICWKESTHRQFDTTTWYKGIAMPLPCYAHDGGYGLMMLTPSNEAQTWNWKTNLTDGVAHLDAAYSRQSVQHVKNFNDPNTPPNLDPLPDPPLSLTSEQHWMNAFSLYRFGTYYYEPKQVGETTLYEWVRLDDIGSDYADEIKKIIEDKPWE